MAPNKSARQDTQQPARFGRVSLLYLVLFGFVVAMLPILVMVYQATHDVARITHLGEVSAREAVDDTRRVQALSTLVTEIERVARQYQVVSNPSFLSTYRDRLQRFSVLFEAQVKQVQGFSLEQNTRDLISQVKEFPGNGDQIDNDLGKLDQLSDNIATLESVTNDLVDTHLQSMQDQAFDIYASLWLELAITLLLTLMAIVYFTWRITHPIRQLDNQIRDLETPPRTTEVTIRGPSELVSLNKRLGWLGSRLDELEAQKRSFLRHMSHELKTPLAAIREGTGLLADGMAGAMGKRQREIVLLIDDSSAELQTLIEQLLDYNQTQKNRALTITRFDVVTLIHEIVAKHRLALESKGQLLELPRRPVYWKADRVRTARIIDNLVSNVIAYGDDHGVLWGRAWTSDEHLVVEIANTGNPIGADDRERLFEPFYQGTSRRKGPLKGSGIGLSVAAESAAVQGGALELRDETDEDVCFRLTLPVLAEGKLSPLTDSDTENG